MDAAEELILGWVVASPVGMKMVRNCRENSLIIPATVFFGRKRKWEWESRTEKTNRSYGIVRTESVGREHADYYRVSITQNEKIHATTSNIKFEKIATTMHKIYSIKRHNQAFQQHI